MSGSGSGRGGDSRGGDGRGGDGRGGEDRDGDGRPMARQHSILTVDKIWGGDEMPAQSPSQALADGPSFRPSRSSSSSPSRRRRHGSFEALWPTTALDQRAEDDDDSARRIGWPKGSREQLRDETVMAGPGAELSYRVLLRLPPAPGTTPTEFTLTLNANGDANIANFPFRSFYFNNRLIHL